MHFLRFEHLAVQSMLIVLEVEYGLMATRFPKGFTDVVKFEQKFSCDSLCFYVNFKVSLIYYYQK